MRGKGPPVPDPDFEGWKIRVSTKGLLTENRTPIRFRVVLSGIISFSSRTAGLLRFPESSRPSPRSQFLVYNFMFYEHRGDK